MTTLVVEELRTTLEQEVYATQRGTIQYIRPLVLLFNDPAGTFYLKLYEGATLLGTASLTMAEIKTGANLNDNEYHWGAIRFELDTEVVIKRKTTYKIELSASGYTFSESSYIGFLKPYEDLVNSVTADFTKVSDYENPIGTEIFVYENE